MFSAQLTIWGKNFGMKQGLLQPALLVLSPLFFWDRDMLDTAVKLACMSQHPFCRCQKGTITLQLYRCLCTGPLSLHSPDVISTSTITAWTHRLCLRAAGWHRPVGPGTFLSSGAQVSSLLHEWLVQVAAPEQSWTRKGRRWWGCRRIRSSLPWCGWHMHTAAIGGKELS